MGAVHTSYDSRQHRTAVRETHGNTVAMDCPYTGKGEEFSPGQLVEAALAGCMLISMGTLAIRHDLDLVAARIDVEIESTDQPIHRFESIDVVVSMPEGIDERLHSALERAADSCPIKHSFAAEIPVRVRFDWP